MRHGTQPPVLRPRNQMRLLFANACVCFLACIAGFSYHVGGPAMAIFLLGVTGFLLTAVHDSYLDFCRKHDDT